MEDADTWWKVERPSEEELRALAVENWAPVGL